ncbi:MAG TPA: MEDS domain-containing protein [Gemmatimonadaceae bacterium]|nr:MEDS domain-containing protein [Gemmatimonadaceae bacterium]
MNQQKLQSIAPNTISHGRRATPAGVPGHDVQFYDGEDFLAREVTKFLAEGVRAGQPLIIVATESHRRQFADGLRNLGFDVDAYYFGSNTVWLDARDTLSAFMEGGMPNKELFEATLGSVFERVLGERNYLVARAYGEMVDLLWKDGNVEGAIALEELWNALAARYSFTLLCAYSMGNFYKEAHTASFQRICAQHVHALPTEEYLEADDRDRLRQLAVLQQRARALEAEVKHRMELETALRETLAHRKRVEDMLRRREAELQDFLDNAPEGMHWVAEDGTVLWANRAELEMLGYEANEFIGKHIAQFHADADVIAEILSRLSRGETLREFQARLRCKDGSVRHVLLNSNVYREEGRFLHTRCFTRDITGLLSVALATAS